MTAPAFPSMSHDLPPEYEVVGELGQNSAGATIYLAREGATDDMVALRVEAAGEDTMTPDQPVVVIRTLGPEVPAGGRSCPICRSFITDWRRYCGRCGTDLSGVEIGEQGTEQPLDLSNLLHDADAHDLDVLGSMRRTEGGAAVHFARERTTGQIVAISAHRNGVSSTASASLSVTSLKPIEPGSLGMGDGERRTPRMHHVVPSELAPSSPRATSQLDGSAEGQKVCPSCNQEFGPAVRFCPLDGSVLRPKEQPDELIGQVIAERFHILRMIGRGGMGQVYLAEHVKMGRRCAIKVMHPSTSDDVQAVSRFAQEAANASLINHRNVATIYDFGETKERLIYLAMEYVEGESLSRVIERKGALDVFQVVGIGRQIAEALHAAHRVAVVHRDLKPDNVLLGRDADGAEVVKVVDFGIAKAMRADADGLTRTGFVVGTPQYMSPEQLVADPVDARTDLYSFGCVLYEMLVGAPAYGERAADLTRRLMEDAPRPSSINKLVPAALDDVVVRALARRPADRFQSAAEMRAALTLVLGEISTALVAFGSTDRRPEGTTAPDHRGATGESLGTPVGDPGTERREVASDATPGSEPMITGALNRERVIRTEQAVRHRSGEPHLAAGVSIPAERRLRPIIGLGVLMLLAGSVAVGRMRFGGALAPADDPAPVVTTTAPPLALPGSSERVEVEAKLRLGALPSGARILVDGRVVDAPTEVLTVTPGEHTISVEAPGYTAEAWSGWLAAGQAIDWSPRLRAREERGSSPAGGATLPLPASQAGGVAPGPGDQIATLADSAKKGGDTNRTAGVDGSTAGASPGPTGFAESVSRSLEGFRQALESRDFDRVRTTVRGMPDALERELRGYLERTDIQQLRAGIRIHEQPVDSARAGAGFLLVLRDEAVSLTLLQADFEATFQPHPQGWRLISIDRRE